MIVAPAILGIIFLILIIASPCIFKHVLKIQSFDGYCRGFCISFLVSVLLTIVGGILFAFVFFTFNLETQLLFNLDLNMGVKIFSIPFKLTIWAGLLGLSAIGYLVLNYNIKNKILVKEDSNKKIFLFFSGFILPLSLYMLVQVLRSFLITDFGLLTWRDGTIQLVMGELLPVIFSLYLLGIMLMMFLYHKSEKNYIKWICLGHYFGPFIFILLGALIGVSFIFYFVGLFFVTPLATGMYFYLSETNIKLRASLENIRNMNEDKLLSE